LSKISLVSEVNLAVEQTVWYRKEGWVFFTNIREGCVSNPGRTDWGSPWSFRGPSDKFQTSKSIRQWRLSPLFLFNNMPIAVSLDTVILKIATSLNKPQELNEGW